MSSSNEPKTSSPPKKPVQRQQDKGAESSANTDTDTTASCSDKKSSSKRGVRCPWTVNEKIRLIKMMKTEFKAMLKKEEHWGLTPWRKIINNIFKSGFSKRPFPSLYVNWSAMKRSAILNEGDPDRSELDTKVLRLLKMYQRTKIKNVEQTSKAEVKAEAKEKEVVKAKNEENQEKNKVHWKQDRDNRQAKLDVISTIKTFGGEIFKPQHDRFFWPKIEATFNAKGHSWDVVKVRSCWYNLLNSAKHAWADQKKANEFDDIVIEFMTKVIQEKNEKGSEATDVEHQEHENNKLDVEENIKNSTNRDDDDDSFDEITERLSEQSNKSPGNASTEDNKDADLNYDYVSLEDIEKGYGVDDQSGTKKEVIIKKEPIVEEDSLPFKIESYTSEQVIEIVDSDDDGTC